MRMKMITWVNLTALMHENEEDDMGELNSADEGQDDTGELNSADA